MAEPSTSNAAGAPNSQSVQGSFSAGRVYEDDEVKHPTFKHYRTFTKAGVKGKQVECRFCKHTFAHSHSRCASHLAEWPGQGRRVVKLCTAVPKEVADAISNAAIAKTNARDDKARAENIAVESVTGRPAVKRTLTDFYGDDAAEKKAAADESVCLCVVALRIPERTVEHPLFRHMVQSIAAAGINYVPPKRRYVGGAGLQRCRKMIEGALSPVEDSWKRLGFTIASDMMTDVAGWAQANIMLINDFGAVFLESVDCDMQKKTGTYIAGMLKPVVEKVGPNNVVAFCTDGGSNYAKAGRKLLEEWPHIEHVPCATHVLDLMMEDFGKLTWAKTVVERMDKMSTFIRNHHMTRAFLRNPANHGGKGLQALKPAGTRFGTHYISVSRLCELRANPTTMVCDDVWEEWALGKVKESADVFKGFVLDPAWWTTAEFCCKLMKLPFLVMRQTDSAKKGMMGRIYDLMLQLTEDINKVLEEDEKQLSQKDKKDIARIVKERWDGSLACALHVAGRILNPANQTEGIFGKDAECTRVMKGWMGRALEFLDAAREEGADTIIEGLMAYVDGVGSFGMPLAKVKEGKMDMEMWWAWNGTDNVALATLARRVLAQPVSASPCERGWSTWDSVHTARRNRLGSEKCRDLVY
ncbi:unnamed protein product, partial [Closterium sp. NIES-53]